MPEASNNFARWLKCYWPAALIGTMWLWMFWPMISGQTVCGFRDSAYLYYPLFKWIDSVWASGEIPLWNPYCNYGLPVVGDGSSSVFYPGKLIFLCRFLSYPSRYGIYLSMHILIAAAGAYRFARVMKANQAGATLAAISYAFGGSVLFQVTNVIYLVSAAWLPFALAFVWRGILGGDWRSTAWAGVVCSLMILGGDPQMVYHVGLIAAASVLFRFWKRRRWLLKKCSSSYRESYRWLAAAGARLILMVVITSCLAAIQILPTAHWAERSERASSREVSNVFQAWNYAQQISEPVESDEDNLFVLRALRQNPPIARLDSTLMHGFFGVAKTGGQKDATYQFSQPPWSIAELFFPNVMGKPFPTHQRWSDALPAAERIWTPSIYVGVFTILLALSQFRLWGKRKRHMWLSRIALFFAIASFGWFGLVWLLNECLAVFRLNELEFVGMKIGPQVGGLYWFMVTFLPKYFMFRYPAKLFVIASLVISVLAGLGLSRMTNTSRKRKRGKRKRGKRKRGKRKRVDFRPSLNPLACASGLYFGIVIGAVCIIGLVTLQIMPIESWLGRIRPNLFFGPLDIDGTISELNLSLAQPLIFVAILTALFWLTRSWNAARASKALVTSIVLLTTIDITIANRWMLAEVDSSVFESPTKIGKQLEELKARQPDTIPRIYRPFSVQARTQTWPRKTSTDRLAEIITWRRETLFPKHHLEHEVALLGSFSSIWPSEYQYFDRKSASDFKLLGRVRNRVLLGDRAVGQFILDPSTRELVFTRCTHTAPELRLTANRRLLQQRNGSSLRWAYYNGALPSKIEVAGIVSKEQTLRQLTAELQVKGPASLVVSTLHDDGWQAQANNLLTSSIESRRPLSVEKLWMHIPLPPGRHVVTFTYSPREFWIGCWISGLSWLGLAIAWLLWLRITRTVTAFTT